MESTTQPSVICELTPAREAALLQGIVPCFEPHLARAYGDGVRLATRSGPEVAVAHEELRIDELVPLLASTGECRRLALHTLRALQVSAETSDAAAAILLEACCHGVVPLVFKAAAEAAARLESESTDVVTAQVASIALCASIINSLAQRGNSAAGAGSATQRALATHNLGINSEIHFKWLAAAGIGVMRDAIAESQAGTTVASIELEAAAQLLHAFFDVRKRTDEHLSLANSCLEHEFCEPSFVRACCVALGRFPNTPVGFAAVRVFDTGCRFGSFVNCMQDAGVAGFEMLLDAISSTTHNPESLMRLIASLSNAASVSASSARLMADKGVFRALQPALFSVDLRVVVRAAYSISSLSLLKEVVEIVGKSDVLEVCETALRTVIPGSLSDSLIWVVVKSDIALMEQMLSVDAAAPVQLAALHMAASAATPRNKRMLLAPSMLAAIRSCCLSSDAFIYSAAISILRTLGVAFPSYRPKKAHEDDSAKDSVLLWSVDAVCAWAGDQIFSAYRQLFRDSLVTGRVLLELSDDDLADMGVAHRLHRRTILHAISDLKDSSTVDGSGVGAGAIPTLPKPRNELVYDVFVSQIRTAAASPPTTRSPALTPFHFPL